MSLWLSAASFLCSSYFDSSAKSLRLHSHYYFKTTTVCKIADINNSTQSQPVLYWLLHAVPAHTALSQPYSPLSPQTRLLLFSCISPWFSLNPSHIKKHTLSSSVTMLQIHPSQAHTLCMLSKQGLYQDFGCELPAYLEKKQVRFDLPQNCSMAKLEFIFMKPRKCIFKMHCSKAQKYQISIRKK